MRGWLALLMLFVLAGAARAAEPFDPFGVAGVDGRPGAVIPLDGMLRDQDGRTVTLHALAKGKPIVLVPVQHRCPNICGATLEGVVRAINTQTYRPGRDFTLVAFGIDPAEKPDAARVSAGRLTSALAGRPRAGVEAVVAAKPDIEAVTRALGYRYAWDPRIGQYAHVAATAVLSADGRLASWLYGVQPPSDVLHTALGAADRNGIGGVAERLLLLCYHYDPATGRYGALAWTMLRVGGAAVIAALALFIGLSLLRERRRRVAA